MKKKLILLCLLFISIFAESSDTLIYDTLNWIKIHESPIVGFFDKAPVDLTQEELTCYEKRVAGLFPEGFKLQKQTLSKFKRELRQVRHSTEKTYTLFKIFHDNIGYDYENPDSLLESRFTSQWVKAAQRERSPMVRHAYALYQPDKCTFGSDMIDTYSYSGVAINANPYYRQSGIKKVHFKNRPDTLNALFTVEKLLFRTPFKARRFNKVFQDSLVATEKQFHFKYPVESSGVYRISLRNKNFYNEYYKLNSDLKVNVKSDPTHIYLFAYDEKTPICGAFHYQVRMEDTLMEGVSDTTAALKFPYEVSDSVHTQIIIERDGHYAFWDGYLKQKEPAVDSTYLFVTSDRTVYRPGDTVNCYGVITQFIQEKALRKPAVDSLRFLVTLGTDSTFLQCPVDTLGRFCFSYKTNTKSNASFARHCTFSLVDTLENLNPQERSYRVNIQEFAEKCVTIKATTDRKLYTPGDTVRISVDIESPDFKTTGGGRLTVTVPGRNRKAVTLLDSLLLPGGFVHWKDTFICQELYSLDIDVRFETRNGDFYEKTVSLNRYFPRRSSQNRKRHNKSGFIFENGSYLLGDTAQFTFYTQKHASRFNFFVEGNEISFFARGKKAHRFTGNLPIAKEFGFNRHLAGGSWYKAVVPVDLVSSLSSKVRFKTAVENGWATVDLSLSDSRGEPVKGTVTVSVVDEDLYNKFDDSSDLKTLIKSHYNSCSGFPNRVQQLYGTDVYNRYGYYLALFTNIDLGNTEQNSSRQVASLHAFYHKLWLQRKRSSSHSCPDEFGYGGGFGNGLGSNVKLGSIKTREGRVPLPLRPDEHDGIYFNKNITTDRVGRASFRFIVPQRSGMWRITVLGTDVNGNVIHERHWIEKK